MARTAVIVLQGVGNQRLGEAAEHIALGMAAHGGVQPTASTEAYLDPVLPEKHGREKWNELIPERRPRREVPRWEIPGAGDQPTVDVFEFGWADLSSFPVRARSFVAALTHLLLEIGYLGERALRGTKPIAPIDIPPKMVRDAGKPVGVMPTRQPQAVPASARGSGAMTRRAGLARGVAQALALALVPLLWAQAWLTLALVLSLALPTRQPTAQALALLALAPIAALVSWLIFAKYPYGIRSLGPTRKNPEPPSWRQRLFRRQMSVLSLLALLVVGVLALIAVWRADADDVAGGLADAVLWMSAYGLRPLWIVVAVLVLLLALSLIPPVLRSDEHDERNEAPASRRRAVTALLTGLLGPTAAAFMAVSLIALVGWVAEQVLPEDRWKEDALPCLSSPPDWTPQACMHLVGQPFSDVRPVDRPGWSALDWGEYQIGLAVAPVLLTVAWLVLAVVISLLWRAISCSRGPCWSPGPPPEKPSVAAAQGRRMSRWTDGPDTRLGSAWILVVVVVSTLLVLLATAAWFADSLWRSDALSWAYFGGGMDAAAVTGGGLTGARLVLLLGSAIGVTALLRNAAWFRGIADVLDRVRDVAVYLREPEIDGARGRDEIQVRFRAFLRHVLRRPVDQRYERLVVVAHSQGSVLATRLLALSRADLLARPKAFDAEPPGPADLPGEISLITFGSPLRALYHRRLPGQFAWLDRGIGQAREDYVTGVTGTWLNFATAGDYIGRRIDPPPREPSWEPERAGKLPFDWSIDRDVLLGPGSHNDYWRDARFLAAIWDRAGRTAPPFKMPKS